MKASDYMAKRIKKETDTIFGITGGAVVNLFNSFNKYKLNVVNMHHEQACAMAADAYARVSGKLGVAVGTSGPGATNLITGTCCSWFDSVPVLTIAGQVPTNQLKGKKGVRQYGFQEIDTVKLFESITKYSKRIDRDEIKADIEIAISEAKYERKGPTFLEFCDDTQREDVEGTLYNWGGYNPYLNQDFKDVVNMIHKAKRPVIILGAGARCKQVENFIDTLAIPTFLTWGAMDILPHNHQWNCRDFGVTSRRAGNLTIQNSDLIICLGTRLDTHVTAKGWGKNAKKIIVDIDINELRNQSADLKINCHIDYFIKRFFDYIKTEKIWFEPYCDWMTRINKVIKEYPLPKTMPYQFIDKLSDVAEEGDIIITDAGQTLTWTMQAWKVKKGQRLFSAFNNSPMGYALPAAIGACFASPKSNIICITGDGGLQMNIQELQTIVGYKLPIKIFVMDNKGYGMIKQTQGDWKQLKDGVACEPYMCDLEGVADAHDIIFTDIVSKGDLCEIDDLFDWDCPEIMRVKIPKGTKIEPKLKYGDSFDNLSPKLSKKEINKINKSLNG